MIKLDYKKELKHLYGASKTVPGIVEVPPMNYLMIDGQGNPNTAETFQQAMNTLFSVSYTLKFIIKKGAQEIDYGVMPLEGLWWVDFMEEFDVENKDQWRWTVMIMQPEFITEDVVRSAIEQVRVKKGLTGLDSLRFASYNEGLAVQIMHIGPFDEEGPTVDKLHNFINAKGYSFRGKHHEIYLSDTRRADPKNWKTIIRQPIE